MFITIQSILLFILKVTLIEWAVELCRYAIYLVRYGKTPHKFFIIHEDKRLHFIINSIESAVVVSLLYFGWSIYFIIGITLITTYGVQKIGSYLYAGRTR